MIVVFEVLRTVCIIGSGVVAGFALIRSRALLASRRWGNYGLAAYAITNLVNQSLSFHNPPTIRTALQTIATVIALGYVYSAVKSPLGGSQMEVQHKEKS